MWGRRGGIGSGLVGSLYMRKMCQLSYNRSPDRCRKGPDVDVSYVFMYINK